MNKQYDQILSEFRTAVRTGALEFAVRVIVANPDIPAKVFYKIARESK